MHTSTGIMSHLHAPPLSLVRARKQSPPPLEARLFTRRPAEQEQQRPCQREEPLALNVGNAELSGLDVRRGAPAARLVDYREANTGRLAAVPDEATPPVLAPRWGITSA